MPKISKIRFTNVIYENKLKRFNDEIFNFDGKNTAILLENGGGKTVFIQCALQAVIPHTSLAGRDIKDTLLLDNTCAHIAIEWIHKDKPRKYCVTAVSLYKDANKKVKSYRFVNEYEEGSVNSIEHIPFAIQTSSGAKRAASKEEISEYYHSVSEISARVFDVTSEYQREISKNYGIIASEWRSQVAINEKEGGIEKFFDGCSTTGSLVESLLIPSVESVMAGEGEKEFAKTLENHRDVLKEYNRLVRTINESDIALAKLNGYVKEYAHLNKVELEMLDMRKQARSLQNFAEQDMLMIENKFSDLNKESSSLAEQQKTLVYKKRSIEVISKKEEMNLAERDLANAREIYEKYKEMYDEAASRKESIRLHKSKYKIREYESKLQLTQEEIERVQKNPELEELQNKYDNYASQLKGVYVTAEKNMQRELNEITLKLESFINEKKILDQNLENENKNINILNNKKSGLEGMYSINDKRISESKRKILLDISHESVQYVLEKYNHRLIEIERRKSDINLNLSKINSRSSEIKIEHPTLQNKRDEITKQLISMRSKLENIDTRIQKIVEDLSTEYKDFYDVSILNFYRREEAIKDRMNVIIYESQKDKEKALLNERIKKRLSDSYSENKYFTAAPELHNIIEDIKSKFGYIQLGSQYIKIVSEERLITKDQILEKFPFWHYVVITSEKDIDRLKQVFKEYQLSCPMLVITQMKAREIIDSMSIEIDCVMPQFWISNLEEGAFLNWIDQATRQGKEAEKIRKEAERNLANHRKILGDIEEFFMSAPSQTYSQMKKEREELDVKFRDLSENIDLLEKELDNLDVRRNDSVKEINELERESEHVNKNREYAQSILKMESENKGYKKDIMEIETQISISVENVSLLKYGITVAEINIAKQSEKRNSIDTQLEILKNEEWYNAVKDVISNTNVNLPKTVLQENLERLKLELLKLGKDKSALQERLSNCEENLKKEEENFEQLKRDVKYFWQEEANFQYEGLDTEISKLEDHIKYLFKEMVCKEDIKTKSNELYIQKEAIYNNDYGQFKSEYEDLYLFHQSIVEVKELLKEEKIKLEERSSLISKEINKVKQDKFKSEQALSRLNGMDREFKFGHLNSEDEDFDGKIDYSYNRLNFVDTLDKKLKSMSDKIREEERAINIARKKFSEYCRTEVSEIKNREALIDLVEKNSDYADLLERQKIMNASLERSKRIATDSLEGKKEKMEHLINSLYSHAEKILSELIIIPKKTRINTKKGWKDIFEINIPNWDKEAARMSISSHIKYILTNIENNKAYIDEYGREDLTKIREFIEKSLKTKQLLRKMMNNSEIRVRCRKVTSNDNVSNQFFSWEESEKWSGGERWSKNMALFMGIQNYIAEKTEPDLRAGKSSSCVLLDNPFGKASSDHVLNPIFFIAKELGFQIITVTAHAEGKFIKDYFPVVYSLRLAESSDGSTNVMTKELIMKSAYFEDKNPTKIDHLML